MRIYLQSLQLFNSDWLGFLIPELVCLCRLEPSLPRVSHFEHLTVPSCPQLYYVGTFNTEQSVALNFTALEVENFFVNTEKMESLRIGIHVVQAREADKGSLFGL